MKTLGKLKLKEEKMLSHEELLSFKGGSGHPLPCDPGVNSVCRSCMYGAQFDCQYLAGHTWMTPNWENCVYETQSECCNSYC